MMLDRSTKQLEKDYNQVCSDNTCKTNFINNGNYL